MGILSCFTRACAFALAPAVLAPNVMGQGQDEQRGVLLGIHAVGSDYSILPSTSPAFSPAARLSFPVTHDGAIDVETGLGSTSIKFDTPSGASSLPLKMWWMGVGYRHQLVRFGGSSALSGALGLGMTTMSHDEFSVPLGAGGTARIPSDSDQRGHILADLTFSNTLFGPLAVVVGTNIRFLTPLSEAETVYSFYGGLTVEVL